MTTPQYIQRCIVPAACELLPPTMDDEKAWSLLMAIGRQESGFKYRRQVTGRREGETTFGPARGWWQFEMGGVEGVLEHPSSREVGGAVLRATGYNGADARMAHVALEHNDVLALCFARLLLWTDVRALPGSSNPTQGWLIYLSTWRPGKPHPEHWAANYDAGWSMWPDTKRA